MQRDYSSGIAPAFESRLPESLVGRISPEAFAAAISGINAFFAEAERRSFGRDMAQVAPQLFHHRTQASDSAAEFSEPCSQCANCLLTGFTFDLCFRTTYQKQMVRALGTPDAWRR